MTISNNSLNNKMYFYKYGNKNYWSFININSISYLSIQSIEDYYLTKNPRIVNSSEKETSSVFLGIVGE